MALGEAGDDGVNSIQDFLQLILGIALLLATPSARVGVVRRKGESFRRQPKGPIEMTAKITPAARKARNARWTAMTAFGIGAALSLGANITVSEHTAVGVITASWAPIALLISLGLLENGSISGRYAKIAVGILAAIAAWASYWHLVEFFTMGGADVVTAHALPLTVDVMMGLASAAMKRKPTTTARRTPAKKAPAKTTRKLASVA